MLNVGAISQGYVLDHIKAGGALKIYHDLGLDDTNWPVAMIMNAQSSKMGRKDILKVECDIDEVNLDIIGFIDHNITVNLIRDEKIIEKKRLCLPKEIHNIIRCTNPRCITSIEQELEHVFILTDETNEIYRCKYCEEKFNKK